MSKAEARTAALAWRCWVKNATNYFAFLSQSGQRAAMSETAYKLNPGELHGWAKERMLGCLRKAWQLWQEFKDDADSVQLANTAAHHWSASLGLVKLIGVAQMKTVPGEEKATAQTC